MRKPRIKLDGQTAVYHCIGRIVGGERLLGDPEKEQFRQMIWSHAKFCGVDVVAYCVMSNHFHLLVRIPKSVSLSDDELVKRLRRLYGHKSVAAQNVYAQFEKDGHLPKDVRASLHARMGDLSVFMKELKHRFSKWFNRRHGRFGTLWAERFKSVVVEDSIESLGTVARYIDLNPVRAGIVDDPKDYRFCSYAEAVAGSARARRGIASFHDETIWRRIGPAYRVSLFVESGVTNSSKKKALDRETILRELRGGGRLPLAAVLRVRVRYFNDGAVLGSRAFVNTVFAEFRDRFGDRRESGARPIRGVGAALSGLCVARDLRLGAIG